MNDLYTCRIIDTRTGKTTKDYTHAYSHLQAVRNFCIRFSYPPYIIEDIESERTGLIMNKEDLFEYR